MRRDAIVSGLLVLILSLNLPCGVSSKQQRDERSISLGVDSLHTVDDMCLMLGAKAVAGDFFKGLQTREGRDGRTFQKRRRIVKSFPERMTVKIDVGFDRCVGKGVEECDRCNLRLDDEFVSSLEFEAYWKHGFDMKKADIDVVSIEQSNDLARVSPTAKLWKYELTVKSENIPLSDVLVVVILAKDGRIVSRLSGRL